MTTPSPSTSSGLLDALRHFSGAVAIAHHIPGRIRLKLADGSAVSMGSLLDAAKQFSGALSSAGSPAIRSVSLNPLARSCTVEYDHAIIAPAAWSDLLAGVDSEAAAALLRELDGAAAVALSA